MAVADAPALVAATVVEPMVVGVTIVRATLVDAARIDATFIDATFVDATCDLTLPGPLDLQASCIELPLTNPLTLNA